MLTVLVIQYLSNILVLGFIIATVLCKTIMIHLYPLIDGILNQQTVEFPEEHSEVRDRLIQLATRLSYPRPENKLTVFESKSGDMHSNAECTRRNIKLASSLLEHHKGHPREVEAIVAHELGHWQYMHVDKCTALDTLYMAVFAIVLKGCINNPRLLLDFGFDQKSFFVSFFLFFKLYSVTFDYPIRRLYNLWYRGNESQADSFAIDQGYAKDLKSALIRNFSANLDSVFEDDWYETMYKSHPGLLLRIDAINEHIKQESKDKQDG